MAASPAGMPAAVLKMLNDIKEKNKGRHKEIDPLHMLMEILYIITNIDCLKTANCERVDE